MYVKETTSRTGERERENERKTDTDEAGRGGERATRRWGEVGGEGESSIGIFTSSDFEPGHQRKNFNMKIKL